MEQPSLPKGTRDFGPAQMTKRQFILDHVRKIFLKYGFLPLETPAMENLSTLTGKYGDEGDQLLFRILNSGDFLRDIGNDVADAKALSSRIADKGLRYDLTVPFARYVVNNRHEIAMPFRRYQIQPVWRADRPQKGRYREFYQCDADVVGTESLICEQEIVLIIKDVLRALGFRAYSIRVNHRGVLSSLAEQAGSGNENAFFVAIDKLEKIGEAKVKEELVLKGFDAGSLQTVFDILGLRGGNTEKLEALKGKLGNSETGMKAINSLDEVLRLITASGSDDQNVQIDASLARGLSYYTGCIFEVKINGVAVGSVSGGGRYDNLTQAFGSKEKLSGVGISFGVDRLYDAMEELHLFPADTQISTKVLICHYDEECRLHGLKVLRALRENGVASEIYPDLTKHQKQSEYARKKMIPFTITIGSNEIESGTYAFKDMTTGEQKEVDMDQLIALLAKQ